MNKLDAERGAVELDATGAVINDLDDRRDRWRRWCGLSKVICMRSVDQSGLGEWKIGASTSLNSCKKVIQMLLRRKQLSLPENARNYNKRLLELGHPATLPVAKAYPQVISGLLWEACWRGMSSPRQVASSPLHAQTLTVKWWTSIPASLRFGPSDYLLRALSEFATNLDRFWQSVVGRMRPYGFYFLDPRLVSLEFLQARSVRATICRRVTILLSGSASNQRVMPGRKTERTLLPAEVTVLLRKSDDIALLHVTAVFSV